MRLLVVEDEHKIAQALKRGLEQEHYAVDIAFDGEDGLASACAETYDAIILDRMLPGMDGATICQKLRSEGNHTPILMLTAKDRVSDRVAGLDSGADDYLLSHSLLKSYWLVFVHFLRRPHEAAPTVLAVGDLQLDPARFSVMRAGQRIMLSSKEFALLEYLMRNAGRVLSKDAIMSHVWDFDADILPNTIEVYIGYLRNKIDKPFAQPNLIHTRRGFGYTLKA